MFARLGHFYPWASPDYLLNRMTPEQVFHYYDMMIWLETGEPPAAYAEQFNKEARWKTYPELAPTPGGGPRVSSR